ncbi:MULTISPECIES: hypothetical protein [Tenacibaculum]|nr:hypothetical protein [Tenacibaculum mesophilum]KAF9657891.1 hypothetical protein HBA12_11765 [Tenacibaculum mesophilum]QFS27037.1 hypothetical protein F9Y86_00925 [Tenacibaculum mesophilum]
MSEEQGEPTQLIIGEKQYYPVENPYYISWLDLNIFNNDILVSGISFKDNNSEGLFINYLDQNLNITDKKSPIRDQFNQNSSFHNGNIESRNIITIPQNNNLYIAYSYLTDYENKSMLIKTSNKGNLIWEKELDNKTFVNNFVIISNNLFVLKNLIVGNQENRKSSILIFDLNSNFINEINFPDEYKNFNDIISLDNESIILSCFKKELGISEIEPYIIKSDLQGNILWELKLHTFFDFTFRYDNFIINKTNNYILSVMPDRQNGRHIFCKVSFEGQLIWKKNITINNFPYNRFEFIEDFKTDNNGNTYLIGAVNEQIGFGPRRMAIAKYDLNGNLEKSYYHRNENDEQWGQSIDLTNKNIYTLSTNYPSHKVSLIKLNFDLEIE